MAKELDAHVEEFRTRRLDDAGPFTFVAADALVLKVREGGVLADVAPTMLKLLGLPQPEEMTGKSILLDA